MTRLAMALLFLVAFSSAAMALKVYRGQVILEELEDYDFCQSKDYDGSWCNDALKRWVKDHPADAFKAGKMTRQHMNAWVAVPFFAQAFDRKHGDCGDADVRRAVVSGLGLPADSNRPIVEAAKKIAFQQCFPQVKDAILEEASIGSFVFKNACHELDAKGALTGLKQKKCQEVH